MIAGVQLYVEINGLTVERCPRVEIKSRRHVPLSGAVVHVPDVDGSMVRNFPKDAPVSIRYGYRGGESATWSGTVQGSERVNRDQLAVMVDGEALPLVKTMVCECYADETSKGIAAHILKHSGLDINRIDIPDEIISRFPVATLPVWAAIRQLLYTLHRSYGQDMSDVALWLGPDGLNLGNFDEDGDVPVVASEANLIRHLPTETKNGLHSVETFLLPGLMHSRLVRLVDSRQGVDKQVRALRVKHVIEPSKMRTFVSYGREHAWC